MEDIDEPRCDSRWMTSILRCLEAHGLFWDGEIIHQSQRKSLYEAALHALIDQDLVFACQCSRKQIQAIAKQGIEGPIYPGTCRHRSPRNSSDSLRLKAPDNELQFVDGFQGLCQQHIQREVGDFVIRRRDGLFSYQLAVVVDDIEQGVNQIVRGIDLLPSTTRQILITQALSAPTADYWHFPVLIDNSGNKLSKQSAAAPVMTDQASHNLIRCLQWLQQEPPTELTTQSVTTILQWAIEHWQDSVLQNRKFVPYA